jgi:chorismate mutase
MNIIELRNEIDKIDHNILELFSMRFAIVEKIAEYKTENNLPIFQEKREQNVLNDRLSASNELRIDPDFTRELFSTIFEYSRKIQENKKISR